MSSNSSEKELESPGIDNYQVDFLAENEEEPQQADFPEDIPEQEPLDNPSDNEQDQDLLQKRKIDYDYEQLPEKKIKAEQQYQEEDYDSPQEMDAETFFKQKYKEIGKTHNQRPRKDVGASAFIQAEELVEKMESAYTRDLDALLKEQPALAKLDSIDDIYKTLKNHQIGEEFLKLNGLALLEKWMNKLPDGTFPSIMLRKKLLEILLDINPTKEQIMGSTIGQLVMQQLQNKSELIQIKNLCKKVIDAWTRIMTENIVDYANTEMNEIDLSKKLKNKTRFEQIDKQKKSEQESKYVQRPVEKKFIFYRIPQRGDDDKVEKMEQSENTKKIMKELINLKKKK